MMQVLVQLLLPKGVRSGARMRHEDIAFNINVMPHPVFKRRDCDDALLWFPKISFEDSMNGIVLTCPHFDGPFDVHTKKLDQVIDPRKKYKLDKEVIATFDVQYPIHSAGVPEVLCQASKE